MSTVLTFGLLFLKGSEKTIASGSRVYLLLFSVHLCIYHFIYLENYLFYKKIGNVYSPYVCVCIYMFLIFYFIFVVALEFGNGLGLLCPLWQGLGYQNG